MHMRERAAAVQQRYKNRKRKQPAIPPGHELVFRYDGPRPRLAPIPVEELRKKLSPEARRTHDNRQKRLMWNLIGAGGGATFGVLVGAFIMFTNGLGGSSQLLSGLIAFGVMFGILGWYVGKQKLGPAFMPKPIWFTRTGANGKPEAITIDQEMPKKIQRYIDTLVDSLKEMVGEERTDQMVPGPLRSGMPSARWDARSLYHIEEMKDEQLHLQGWAPKEPNFQVAKVGMLVFAVLVAVVATAIILSNEAQKRAPDAAAVVVQWLT